MKNKKESVLKESYSNVWNYIKESKNYIYGISIAFLVFAVLGYFFPNYFVEEIKEMIRMLLEATQGMNAWQLTVFIFFNNTKNVLMALLLGIVFGILPVAIALLNGYVLGFVTDLSVKEGGFLSLWRILPHGIFELPAVMIGLGLGLKFGMFMFAKKPTFEFKKRFLQGIQTFVLVILPLLIIAAVIEGLLIAYLS
jgi:stage II sporulation protein M